MRIVYGQISIELRLITAISQECYFPNQINFFYWRLPDKVYFGDDTVAVWKIKWKV